MKKQIVFLVLAFQIGSPASAETTMEAIRGVFSESWNKKVLDEHMKTLNPEVDQAVQTLKQGLPTPLCGYEDVGFTSAASLRLALTLFSKSYGNGFQAVPINPSASQRSQLCVLVSGK